VLEVVKSMEKAHGGPIKHEIADRRKGDVGRIVANVQKAKKVLGWEPVRNLDKMCEDALRFTNFRYKLQPKA
jgi:UDP-glucose 4-epimerase